MIRTVFDRLRQDENGFALPEVIVSIILNSILLTVVATSVITFLTLQDNLEVSSGASTELSLADTAWRSDVQGASVVGAVDGRQVTFTVPNADGTCRQSTWTVQTLGERTKVLRRIANFAAIDPGTTSCTGAPSPAITQTIVDDANADSGFLFTNRSGRGLTFAAGVPAATAAGVPAGTTAGRWAELGVGAATLTVNGSFHEKKPIPIIVTQVATSVYVPTPTAATTGTPDAGASHVN